MEKLIYIIHLVISSLGFLLFSLFSGIVGSYAIEFKKDPSIFDKTIYAFNSSSYPYYACVFLLWFVIVVLVIQRKRKITPTK
jgi:phosphotransferase system  glucose/maltose/N-acetylglucosamine-specific IIC component